MAKERKGMRTFIIIWLGQLTSLIGSGLIGFALSVWVFEQTGQATPFALTALFSVLPHILLAPIGGAVSDRWNRKAIMVISDSLAGLTTLAAAFLLLTGRMEIWMIYVITTVEAVCGAFQQPAYSASIVMLVPKEQLTRANSMMQMGQAIQSIVTPLLAGVLVTTVGMKGIIIIDIATYLLALVTLISVRISQPERKEETNKRFSVLKDVAFGWHYLVARKGLLGLLLYFASVNFFMNLSAVMLGPLILSFGSATSLGIAQTVMGVGMLAGSLIMSVWGGFKTGKVKAIIGFIVLSAIGFMVAGLRPSVIYVSAGLFFLMFFLPFGSGPSAALFAAKVAPDVQGRVFATRSMISQSMMPVAFLLSGILADHVFNPLLVEGGALANTFVGRWLGVGPSRGIGLMMITSGLILTVVSLLVYLNPRIRNIESEIPDAVPEVIESDLSGDGEVEMVPAE